jgi:hypothetical protein
MLNTEQTGFSIKQLSDPKADGWKSGIAPSQSPEIKLVQCRADSFSEQRFIRRQSYPTSHKPSG